jgi:hypothetical protein
MTRLREVPNFRELKGRSVRPFRDELVFLDPQLLDFSSPALIGECRVSLAHLLGGFPFTFRPGSFNNFFFLILEGLWQRTC